MAEMIRTSYTSLDVIPEIDRHLMHSMYEDSDIDGANEAEALFDFIERVDPGRFVIVLANDSVTPPCSNSQGHYHCDYYAPYWYTVLVPMPIWEQYKARVEAQYQEWIRSHGCKIETEI